jgi:hypothetical protein
LLVRYSSQGEVECALGPHDSAGTEAAFEDSAAGWGNGVFREYARAPQMHGVPYVRKMAHTEGANLDKTTEVHQLPAAPQLAQPAAA